MKSLSVLVIDDDPTICEALSDTLSDEGWTVIAAHSGLEGWQRLQELEPPTAIVLDVVMPGMSGQNFVEALRQDRARAGIPVIQISAAGCGAIPGVAARLDKPFRIERLLHLLGTFAVSQSASDATAGQTGSGSAGVARGR